MTEESGIPRWQGLTQTEAAQRLAAEGSNELPVNRPRTLAAIALDVLQEPMLLLLLTVVGIYAALGDLAEAAALSVAALAVIGITLYQEQKSERALEALRDLSSPRAQVVRDGRTQRIPGSEVVRGDYLVLNEGDRVAADARVTWATNLTLDESQLTGESAPVPKRVATEVDPAHARPGGENSPFVFSGSLVTRGSALAEVTATGVRSELGRIGKVLATLTPEPTPLQRETRAVVWRFAVLGLALCATVVVVYGLTRHDWLHGWLAGLTLAMSILPEEIPVVLVVFLALGAWRISKSHVLTRRIPAVETLGCATVLCADKTGTLTQNRMTVRSLHAHGQTVAPETGASLPAGFDDLAHYAVLACAREPFDPMEKAIHALAPRNLLPKNLTLVREYPLTPKRLALTHAWRTNGSAELLVAAKGAPETIFKWCRLPADARAALERTVAQLSDQGLRLLGAARATWTTEKLPDDPEEFEFTFLGLVALEDPIRPAVPGAIAECRRAGIRVLMITGDYPGTARSIARQIGLTDSDGVMTGAQLDALGDNELHQRIRHVHVFARVVPEQKLRIVQALKATGEIVAMTGDGVNDAPALKAAHIGVAMGARGTDVAREAADLVLTDDDFSSIVAAVRLGRRIRDNLSKAMGYIFAVHVPAAGLTLVPVLFGWPLILLPVHIVFLELIIDPACSIAFEAEPEETDLMCKPPRQANARLFDRRTVSLGLLQGVGVLAATLVVYGLAKQTGYSENEVRTLTFTALVAGNLALIFSNRSWSQGWLATLRRPNPALWWIVGSTFGFLALVFVVPTLREIFRFAPLGTADIALSAGAGLLSIFWFEIYKKKNSTQKR